MSKTILATVALLLTASTQAATITGLSIGGSIDAASENWEAGHTWQVRVILADSSLNVISPLSAEVPFNTVAGAAAPTGFRITLGPGGAPTGANVVVYRSTAPFNAGDTVDLTIYTGLCPAGCNPGDLIVPVSGQLNNSDFRPNVTALPVRLEAFSVD